MSVEEEIFLSNLKNMCLTEEEKKQWIGPTEKDEISYILKIEVDPDSSPGEDGIQYRFIIVFLKFDEYQEPYLAFLNFFRDVGSSGVIENVGVMPIKK